MKRIIVKTALLAFSIVTLAAVPAFAQLTGRYHADIPFDFTTGGTNMTAGSYTIGVLDITQATGPLVLQAQNGKAFKVLSLVRRGPDEGLSGGKLIFLKNGDEYVLSRIDTPQYSWRAKRTATSVKELAKKGKKADTVEVNIAAGN